MIRLNRSGWMKPLCAAGFILVLSFPTFSWGAGGHMMVARIAYNRLNANARAQVDKLARVKIDPPKVTAKSLNFVSAAHWADDIRSSPELEFIKELHFVDLPFSADSTRVPADLPGDKTIITALNQYVDVLKNSSDENERAQALRLVIHFVGDIHQPLHCATRVTREHEEGDRGGNLFVIKIRGANNRLKNSNLHSYWDGGIGTFPKTGPNFAPPPLKQIGPAASRITRKFPASREPWKKETLGFDQWAAESETLARNVTYRRIVERQVPTARYNRAAVEVVERRVAWAGYRLAELLNSIWPDNR